MNRPTVLAAAAASLALLGHGTAFAVASSSAEITNFGYTLYDLNPLDGVTPWITFAGNSYVSAAAYQSDPYDNQSQTGFGASAFDPVSASASTAYSTAQSNVTGTALSASGSTQGTVGAPGSYGQYSATAYFNGYTSNGFTLSNNTLVLFTGAAQTSAATTAPYDPLLPYNNQEYAQSDAYLYVYGAGASGGGSQSSSDGFSSYAGTYYYGYPSSDSKSAQLSATFANTSGGQLTGTFYAYTNAYGQSYATAVPEPETYAMLIAGLSVVGAAKRRRQRH